MQPMTVAQIAALVGDTRPVVAQNPALITQITTDTRQQSSAPESALFVALRGEAFDGHRYVQAALDGGKAAYALVDQGDGEDPRLILCRDTQQGFLDLGRGYRQQFSPKMVAITGSVGKTTTKEMVAQVLSARYSTLKTQGNLNNRVGLPKTLLELGPQHQAAVIELGMNSFGEMSDLSRCALPDLAVITNIGVSHIEFLGSREGILRAKLEILDGLRPGSPLILCGDDDLLCQVHRRPGWLKEFPVLTYGIQNPDCDVRASRLEEREGSTLFELRAQGGCWQGRIPTFGAHNVLNALAAFAVGRQFGMEPEEILQALAGYVPSGMRQRVVLHGGLRVVEDCYNAGPDSVRAALAAFGQLPPLAPGGRRVMVLADMLELGDYAPQAHREAGEQAAQAGVDLLYCYGPLCEQTAQAARQQGCPQVFHFEDKGELTRSLLSQLQPGDTLWLKGSRGMRLEEILDVLYQALPTQPKASRNFLQSPMATETDDNR